MREMNITAKVGTFVGRTAAPPEAPAADHRLAPFTADFTAPQKRGTGRPAKPLPLVAAHSALASTPSSNRTS
jgi:hypothetical protein